MSSSKPRRDNSRVAAIPTRYARTNFRSALEAKWACVFDLLRLEWEYEPLTLGTPDKGYIPDFIVHTKLFAGHDKALAGPVLVEIRPLLEARDYRETIARIAHAGWEGPAVVLGATVRRREFWIEKPEWWCGYAHPKVRAFHAEPVSNEWFPVGVQRDAKNKAMFAFGGEFDLTGVWREASNRVQWKPAR